MPARENIYYLMWPNASARSRTMRTTWELRKDYICKKCGDHARSKKVARLRWGCPNCDVVTYSRKKYFRKVGT
jgi:ribosomal protein L37AE/L43A